MDSVKLKQNIKHWVQLDHDIQEMRLKIKEKTQEKTQITQDIMNSMKDSDIKCVELNTGKIMYKSINVRQPITKKHLIAAFETYFQNDVNARQMIDTILDSRPIHVKETISLKPKKETI